MTEVSGPARLERVVLLGAGLVVIAAGLRAAAPAVNLVLISLLLAMTVYPIPHLLARRGVPRPLAVVATLLIVLVGGAVVVLALAVSLRRLIEEAPKYGPALAVLFFVINLVADNVLKPKVMGQGLGISPLLIVLSLLAWMFVLGPLGALLAIPLSIAVVKIVPLLVGGGAISSHGGSP